VSGVDINAIYPGNFIRRIFLEVKGIEESALVEVQSINLMTGSGDDGIA